MVRRDCTWLGLTQSAGAASFRSPNLNIMMCMHPLGTTERLIILASPTLKTCCRSLWMVRQAIPSFSVFHDQLPSHTTVPNATMKIIQTISYLALLCFVGVQQTLCQGLCSCHFFPRRPQPHQGMLSSRLGRSSGNGSRTTLLLLVSMTLLLVFPTGPWWKKVTRWRTHSHVSATRNKDAPRKLGGSLSS